MNENATSGVVTEAGQTSTGKPKLKIGGHWYYLGRALKGASPPIGASIELKYSLFGDKGDLRSLEAWRPYAVAVPQQEVIPLSAPVDEASLRFISNVVGNAIQAGTIKEPAQIAGWFNAARNAVIGKPGVKAEQKKPESPPPPEDGFVPDFDDMSDVNF